jgi:uncharacterized membrane protein
MLLYGTTPILEKLGLKEVEPMIGFFIRSGVVTLVVFVVFIFTGRIGQLAEVSLRNILSFLQVVLWWGFLRCERSTRC